VYALRRPLAGTALVVALAGCDGKEPPALTVGSVGFTEDELLGLSESRRQALIGLTALGLAVADSTTAELGAPQIAEWADDRLIDILAAELTLEKNEVSDEVLLARYALEPAPELTVRHILVFSERWRTDQHRADARAKATRALRMLEDGMDFPAVGAALWSDGGAEARQGTLPPGREGAWVDEFWAAATALGPGELSRVTETQYGFHVLRLEDRRLVPFEEARSAVAREVAGTIENPRAVLDAWASARGQDAPARRVAALQEALARGLAPAPADQVELLRRWETLVASWTSALGFRYGLTPDQVARASLQALASPGQMADIARTELLGYHEALTSRYPVSSGTP
jgi:hypothetical protein